MSDARTPSAHTPRSRAVGDDGAVAAQRPASATCGRSSGASSSPSCGRAARRRTGTGRRRCRSRSPRAAPVPSNELDSSVVVAARQLQQLADAARRRAGSRASRACGSRTPLRPGQKAVSTAGQHDRAEAVERWCSGPRRCALSRTSTDVVAAAAGVDRDARVADRPPRRRRQRGGRSCRRAGRSSRCRRRRRRGSGSGSGGRDVARGEGDGCGDAQGEAAHAGQPTPS